MLRPAALKEGDKVAFVSTARKCMKNELAEAAVVVESWGLEVVYGQTIDAEDNQFAGDDNLRAQDFQQMLDDDEIKAIFCAKGGYGTVRIIDKLNFEGFAENPKWIIGYSDVTVIHAHVQENFAVCTLHGPLLFEFGKIAKESLDQLKTQLFGEDFFLEWQSSEKNRYGQVQGRLIGGNLSVLYSLSASVSEVSTKNAILFLEDLDEYLYHVDRMMMQLLRSGKLNELGGLIIGGMTEMRDNKVPFGSEAIEIIQRVVKPFDYPLAFYCPAGHVKSNNSLPLGTLIRFDCNEKYVKLKKIHT
ncbi:MAG: LD-carboxypeptidase [Chitinophagaceae bacterium]|nr:MAG: LD-carboxypeptidase [Chitinophagaceae bacterium]